MFNREMTRTGHWPTLLTAFLYFDLSFSVWVLLGVLAIFIAPEFGFGAAQTAFLVAIPTLSGAFFRIPLGYLSDVLGARRTALAAVSLSAIPLFIGWIGAQSVFSVYAIAVCLGAAGGSFAVAMPLAGRWYRAEQQGIVLGIVGAGNTGTLLATFFAPRLAAADGWNAVFGLALLPMAAVWLLLFFVAREAPAPNQGYDGSVQTKGNRKGDEPGSRVGVASIFRNRDAWIASGMYALTFGGFVGLGTYAGVYFRGQFGLSPIDISDRVTLLVLAGSVLRPAGGWLADRHGAPPVLAAVFAALAALAGAMPFVHSLSGSTLLLLLCMSLFGIGNGALFQVLPLLFEGRFGLVSGMVGEAGGLGGFFFPMALGLARAEFGSFQYGFLPLSILSAFALLSAIAVYGTWRRAGRRLLYSGPASSARPAGITQTLDGER